MKTQLRHILTLATVLSSTALFAGGNGGEMWMKYCKKCHGDDGKAETIMGKKFGISDYTAPAVQSAMTDEDIRNAIVDGVTNEDGRKVMIAFGKRLSDTEVDSLVSYVRSLAPSED